MEKGTGTRVKILLALILGMSGLSAHAADAGPDCQNAQDQTSLNICAVNSYHAADNRLNLTYDALNKKTSVPGKMRLKQAQRAWIGWRDAQCDFEATSTSAYSARPMVYAGCLESLTVEQTKRLDAQMHCAEGDIGCGGH